MEIEQPDVTSMWGCMFAGDMAIENVKKKSVLIVGNSRIGKSTLYNYLSGVTLKGVQDQEIGQTILQAVHQIGVEAANTLKSVTLVPNKSDIVQNNDEIGLIDTAGLGDEGRSYAGQFGVSYMLQKIFENINQVKFMICVNHPIFFLGGIKGLLQPLLRFVEMLECERLIADQDTAKKFYNSISIVVTKSQIKVQQYLVKIRNAIDHLQKDKNIDNQKKVVKALLSSILQNKRLTGFQQGQDGVQLPKSSILQQLNDKNWQFYPLSNQNLSRDYLIKLPFQKTLSNMAPNDVQSYKNDTTAKHKLMQKSYELLKKFIKTASASWYSQEPINYEQEFNILQQLIQGHPYGNFESMINFLKLEFTIPQYQTKSVLRTDLVNQMKKMNQYAQSLDDEASNQSETFNKIVKMYKPCFQIFDLCRKTFCNSRSEERKFLTFMFINMRSLYQCQMQSKVHKGQSASVPFIITGSMSSILPEGIWDFLASFLIGFSAKTNKQKQAYISLIQQCLAHMNEMRQSEKVKQLIYILIKYYLKTTDDLIKQKKHHDGLNFLFKASRQLKNYMSFLPPFEDMQQKDQLVVTFKENQIFKKMGQCLEGMKLHSQAIKIYKNIKAISLVIRCYQDWIKITKKKKSKINIMQPYGEFLEQYGKKGKLIQLYEKMIDQFECFPKKRKAWKLKLATILKNGLSVSQYAERLRQKQKSLENSNLIYEIQSSLSYYVPENQDSSEEDIEETFKSYQENMEEQDDN